MKTRITLQHSAGMKIFFPAIFLLWVASSVLPAQEPLYGPENPPPKASSITFTGTANDGQIGFNGGKLFTITNIELSNSTTVYFTMLDGEIKLSMDGSDYGAGEVLTYSAAQSDPAGGFLVWLGSTRMPIANPGGTGIAYYQNLNSRFTATILDPDSQPVTLTGTDITGLPSGTGAAAEITGSSQVLKVRLQMFVSDNGGSTWTPHLVYYNNAQTPAGIESAYSSVDFGFYWENDPPELSKNLAATVDEGDTLHFSNAYLEATDVESPESDLLFIIDPREDQLLPSHGNLALGSKAISALDTFTMAQVLSDTLYYIHDGSESVLDSVSLMLTDGDGTRFTLDGTVDGDSVFYFLIHITPVDDPPTVEVLTGGTVDEQDTLFISNTMLHTSDPESNPSMITYTLDPTGSSDYPMNGLLKLNGIPLSDGGTFTQADIDAEKLNYQHDGSPTLTDGFVFKVADEFGHFAEDEGNDQFFFDITIHPVNDAPKLTKLHNLEIDEGGTGIINNTMLAAEDEEHAASEIMFTLDPDGTILDPLHGVVKLDGQALDDGDSFTMEDINSNLVTYEHDGSEESADFFGFRISDTEGGVTYDGEYSVFHFNISITGVNDLPVVANPIADHSTKAGETYNFTFPENTFTDDDIDDELSYEAKRADESDLPVWLSFNAESRNFSGTPAETDVGTVSLVIIAHDEALEEARDTFELEVISGVGIESHTFAKAVIYPNPATSQLHIELQESSEPQSAVSLLNITGRELMKVYLNTGSTELIDIKDYPAGIYFLRIVNRIDSQTFRFIKE